MMTTTTSDIPAATPAATDPSANDTVTVAEAAAYFNRPDRTVRRWAATGKLAAERVAVDGGREEWRIHRHALATTPDVTAPTARPRDRSSAAVVPLELYRATQERLDAAQIQVGQLIEVRQRLELAEHSQDTMREKLAEAEAERTRLAAELDATTATIAELRRTHRRRWFKRS